MSIQSEINRISGNVSDAFDAIEAKGVTIPSGSNSDDLADLIAQIPSVEIPTYTATISGTGSAYTSAEHDSVTYYTDGESFEFAEGDTILLRAEGMRAGGSIVIDGVTVANDSWYRVSYNYSAPASDITISLEYSSQGSVTVETQSSESITVEPLSVTNNGTYTAPSGKAYSPVTVNVSGGTPNLQAKTASPTTSQQTITADSGYDGLSSVQINAMPSGSATPAASISGSSASVSTGTNTITLSKTVSNTPQVSAGYVSSGTDGNTSVSLTASVTTKGATTYNTSSSDQTIASGTYLTGTQTIKAVTVSGLSANSILSGTTVKIGDANDDDRIASVSGNVTFSTIYTGSSTPSSSTGVNGDIYIKTA